MSAQSVNNLDGIYRALSPLEQHFFDVLDEELDKVEKFYIERSSEQVVYSSLLRDQLRELEIHRKIYHVCMPCICLPSLNLS